MIYTPLTYKAMRICYEAHKDVLDASGAPYVFHPFIVANRMKDEITTCVALLHDVVEDTDWTFEDLIAEHLGKETPCEQQANAEARRKQHCPCEADDIYRRAYVQAYDDRRPALDAPSGKFLNIV